MQQSTARQSHMPYASNSAATAKLLEKKKEFEAVAALERASATFVKRIEELGDDFDVMAEAGRVHGQVLEQWPNMFRILSLFMATREQHMNETEAPTPASGERLVRVPIEDLQSRSDKS